MVQLIVLKFRLDHDYSLILFYRYFQCATINCYATASMCDLDKELYPGRIKHASHCLPNSNEDEEIKLREWIQEEMDKKWWPLRELYDKGCQK